MKSIKSHEPIAAVLGTVVALRRLLIDFDRALTSGDDLKAVMVDARNRIHAITDRLRVSLKNRLQCGPRTNRNALPVWSKE
jgi:hypothetical protein